MWRKTARRNSKTMTTRLTPLALQSTRTNATWFEEPPLSFSGQSVNVDPKVGIPLYGPRSLNTPRHKTEVTLASSELHRPLKARALSTKHVFRVCRENTNTPRFRAA